MLGSRFNSYIISGIWKQGQSFARYNGGAIISEIYVLGPSLPGVLPTDVDELPQKE